MGNDSFESIHSGDLLIWDQPNGSNGSFWLNLVRLATVSEYGHVSIAVVKDDGLYHIEAVMPRIKMSRVDSGASFYVLPMSRRIKDHNDLSFFDDKLGMPYGIMDALRAYFGLTTVSDDHWQCAEICLAYYQEKGLDIDLGIKTPARLVRALMNGTGLGLFRFN